jgi:hypothetical protein
MRMISQSLRGALDGGGCRLFPGLAAGPDDFDDLVVALRHGVLPILIALLWFFGLLLARRNQRRSRRDILKRTVDHFHKFPKCKGRNRPRWIDNRSML